MKTLLISISLALVLPGVCASFNSERFGASLNGWDKNGVANYQFTDAKYRTHSPTITTTPSGGVFLSTRVDLLASGDQRSVCHVGLGFSRSGILESAQIKGVIGKKSVDTGVVRRPEAPLAAAAAEGVPVVATKPFHATDEMIVELFTRFDAEVAKVNAGREKDRADLFSRLTSQPSKRADLSAGLRHNLNLILQNVR